MGHNLAPSILRADILPIHVSSFPSCEFYPTTSEEILKCINSLKQSAVGRDVIKSTLLKAFGSIIAMPLSYVIHSSFEHSIFPDQLKYAVVTHSQEGIEK